MTRAFSNQGWGLLLLAMMLCPQMAVGWRSPGPSPGPVELGSCSSNIKNYSPNHFVLVHGIGGGAWFWFEIQTLLQNIGFNSTAVDLTAAGINKAVADDVTTVEEYTKPLIDAIANIPGQVILVGHSLGGGSIAYASQIYGSKISKAIYLSACMPKNGQSMFSSFPNTTFPRLLGANDLFLNFANGPSNGPTSVSATLSKLGEFYMSDTPLRYVNLAKVVFTSTPYQMGVVPLNLTSNSYGKVKRYYIRTGKDLGVLTSEQDIMIAANPPQKVFNIPDGDHAVFFSEPWNLFKILLCISSL